MHNGWYFWHTYKVQLSEEIHFDEKGNIGERPGWRFFAPGFPGPQLLLYKEISIKRRHKLLLLRVRAEDCANLKTRHLLRLQNLFQCETEAPG